MKVVQVQFAPWDKKYHFSYEGLELKVGDTVVVETDLGTDLASVVNFSQLEKNEDGEEIKPILRLASANDLEQAASAQQKQEALNFCQSLIDRYNLPMKLVDVRFALGGSRINFAFAAEGRVDFRQLVKDLTIHFNVGIRLTQIGARDEARVNGDCGHCGQNLCCRGFIKDFSSVTSEMAETQQVVHRGSERISGMCGRLMCCLAYEYEGYQEMAKKMPPLGAKVNVDGKRGEVIGHHVLKQSVDVKFQADKDSGYSVVEVDLNRHDKKKK
ncbi:MAG TPA: regulatory iron-sulfur-containing complex subunit RicT [bacterium]|nr:regulatory iron-sulfur-containing complex subunit RicT [bacterium]HPT29620.1 regulatory iron-sulfur-containing complex subunit RicT [bacterium]